SLIPLAYLVAAVTFILGLKGLSSPTTAVMGNRIAAAGMLVAVIATFFTQDVQGGVPVIVAGMLVGGVAGFAGARMVKMTAMPQMVALVLPIGGADMPVVISLLNAYTGLAVAMAGFTLANQLLVVAGTLVGASGTILTRLMSKAMNRSLGNVLFGAFGAATAAGAAGP